MRKIKKSNNIISLFLISAILIFEFQICSTQNAININEIQWYIAQLKHSENSLFFQNEDIKFEVTNKEKFLYLPNEKCGMLKNGLMFSIEEKDIIKIDTSYFKFEYPDSVIYTGDLTELEDYFSANGISYQMLIKSILQDNFESFSEFIKLGFKSDGASAEIFSHVFWQLINLLPDKLLADYIKRSDKYIKTETKEFMFDNFYSQPFGVLDPKKYLLLFYPETCYELNRE